MSINRDDIVFLRDTFIDAEGDYLDQLLKYDKVNKLICDLSEKFNDLELYNMANDLIQSVDFGEIKDEDMELVETKILILLVAIRDIEYRKQLVKTFNYNNIIVGDVQEKYLKNNSDNPYRIQYQERERGRGR